MLEKPLFSILIPVYNVEKYIKECVISILKQTFCNFEIIIVDDGSSDKSPKICDDFKCIDNRIKVIHKENAGVSKAREDGAKKASGEYIVCIDADDWIDSNCLKKIAKVIEETSVDIVCYGAIYDNGKKLVSYELPYRHGYYSHEDIEKEIFPMLIQKYDATYFSPSLWGKAIKKELFLENILANKFATIGEDGACIIPCVFHAKSMYVIKNCYYYYRYNMESATKSGKVFNWDWPRIVSEHISNNINMYCQDFKEQLNRKIAHDIFLVAVSQFNRKDSYFSIVRSIDMELNNDIYALAIKNCKFRKSLKASVMEFVLKKRVFFLIYLYSKYKYIKRKRIGS